MADAKANATAEQKKVARDFEAIFMRQLLSSMEKTGGIGGAGTGAGVYRSMLVGAIADSAAEGGGIGLSDMILEAMLRADGAPAMDPHPAAAASAQAPQVFHADASVANDRASQLTPVGDFSAKTAPLNLIRDTEKDVTSRGAPKGGGK
jgi:flagellar protein FlgJ